MAETLAHVRPSFVTTITVSSSQLNDGGKGGGGGVMKASMTEWRGDACLFISSRIGEVLETEGAASDIAREVGKERGRGEAGGFRAGRTCAMMF